MEQLIDFCGSTRSWRRGFNARSDVIDFIQSNPCFPPHLLFDPWGKYLLKLTDYYTSMLCAWCVECSLIIGRSKASEMEILLLLLSLTSAFGYLPPVKDNFLSGYFLRDLVNRINGKGISEGDGVSYLDFTDGLSLDSRSVNGGLEEEPMFPLDYDAVRSFNMHPTIRDQEYLQRNNLWGKQFISGGAGEGSQLLRPEGMKNKQEVKTDSTLPAYCNPPNPCPVGYTEEQGCIEEFENSATFSRRYQASQDCMCDTEHMFECPNSNNIDDDDNMDMMDSFGFNSMIKSKKINPFLTGEKLPVAAKKGNNVL